jgi:copper(I)-binding protein
VSRSTIGSARPLARHAALLIAAATLLTGCSAGQVSETARKIPSVPGVNTSAGDIAIRNALVAFPEEGEGYKAGSEVPLEMRLVNLGEEADALVGATSPNASRVELRAGADAPTANPTETAAPDRCRFDAPPAATPTGSPTATPGTPNATPGSPTATPTGSPNATPPSLAPIKVELKPGCLVTLAGTAQQLVLVGLAKDLGPGDLVTVRLQFEKSGSATLELPIDAPSEPLPRQSPESEGEGEH